MSTDIRGLPLATQDSSALEAFERALVAFRTYRGDPIAPLDEAICADPGFALAHVAKSLILMTFFERRFSTQSLEALDAGRAAIAKAGSRERAMAAAARRLAEGDWHGAVSALDLVLAEYPREGLALQTAHLVDFMRGDALNLRNRVSRVLPHWSAAIPGYSFVLGMHSFGLEECNQYPEAEAAGLHALSIAPEDCWAVHAVTHVYEMQGRIDEGIRFLDSRQRDWATDDNGFAFHNWWHLALFHMDRGDNAAALAIYDRVLVGAQAMAISRLDATSLLWRLKLEGADVGSRFDAVADAWQGDLEAGAGFYGFNDFHSALAFAATGRASALRDLRQRMEVAGRDKGSNAGMTTDVAIPVCDAAEAFAAGRYDIAAERILAVRDGAWRFGGSHAQRDVLSLTLIEAARRAGNKHLARHIVGERLVHKPKSAWGRRIAERIDGRPTEVAHAAMA